MARSEARGTILAGGVALVGGALAFLGVFSHLAARFHGVLPLVFIPGGVAAFEALRERASGPMRVGLQFAFLAAVSMILGLMRWPSEHWELARSWVRPPKANASCSRRYSMDSIATWDISLASFSVSSASACSSCYPASVCGGISERRAG